MSALNSVLNIFRLCLFTEVKGVVTMNGEPVAGAEVVQECEWNSKTIKSYITDDLGCFHFPPLNSVGLLKILPFEQRVSQRITIRKDGLEYLAWKMSKRNLNVLGELDLQGNSHAKTLRLICELTADSQTARRAGYNRQSVIGCARWPEMDIPDNLGLRS